MLLTTREGAVPPFLGVDLTDGTARRPRAVDVCGLSPRGAGLVASFWEWRWGGDGIAAVAAELRAARCAALDGPHALAAPGRSLRTCERLCAAAGKTPDDRAGLVPGRPYAGFTASALDLFAALDAAGLAVSPPRPGPGIWETYPGYVWRRLAPGLAPKATERGRRERARVLAACGIVLPRGLPGHDRLDAAVCALVAAAACGAVPGLSARIVGEPTARRPDGTLEEGPILALDVAAPPGAGIARAPAGRRTKGTRAAAARPMRRPCSRGRGPPTAGR